MKKLVFIIAAAFLAACTKEHGDSEPPVVTLTSPTNLQTFSAGQSVPVKASISDNDTLMSIHLNISGPDFIHYAYVTSSKSYNFSEDIPVSVKGNYTVSLEVFDKTGNHAEAKVDITVN